MSDQGEQHRRQRRAASSGSGVSPRQILLGVLVVVALWFALTNSQKVEIDYIIGSANTPLWLLILLCVGLGMLIDRVLVLRGRHQDRRQRG